MSDYSELAVTYLHRVIFATIIRPNSECISQEQLCSDLYGSFHHFVNNNVPQQCLTYVHDVLPRVAEASLSSTSLHLSSNRM